MITTNSILQLTTWLWDNPWMMLAIFAAIALTAILLSSGPASRLYQRGLPRCRKCLDGSRTRYKVAYPNQSSAEAAANHYMKRFGYQRAYFQPTFGYWHLTSQERRTARPRRNRR